MQRASGHQRRWLWLVSRRVLTRERGAHCGDLEKKWSFMGQGLGRGNGASGVLLSASIHAGLFKPVSSSKSELKQKQAFPLPHLWLSPSPHHMISPCPEYSLVSQCHSPGCDTAKGTCPRAGADDVPRSWASSFPSHEPRVLKLLNEAMEEEKGLISLPISAGRSDSIAHKAEHNEVHLEQNERNSAMLGREFLMISKQVACKGPMAKEEMDLMAEVKVDKSKNLLGC